MANTGSPAEYAILGLLDAESGPGHGYDLARNFTTGQPLAEILRLEPGMLYHHLKKLERRGCVESSTEQQGARPPRQIYHLTEEGRGVLRRWLTAPVSHTREVRLDFLIKLFFAQRTDPELAARLVADQLDASRQWEVTLQQQSSALENAGLSGSDLSFSRTVLELRLAQTRAAVEWLQSMDLH